MTPLWTLASPPLGFRSRSALEPSVPLPKLESGPARFACGISSASLVVLGLTCCLEAGTGDKLQDIEASRGVGPLQQLAGSERLPSGDAEARRPPSRAGVNKLSLFTDSKRTHTCLCLVTPTDPDQPRLPSLWLRGRGLRRWSRHHVHAEADFRYDAICMFTQVPEI